MQSKWKTCPQLPNAMESPFSFVLEGLAWYSIEGSFNEFLQMAQVSAHMSHAHIATAVHFLMSNRGTTAGLFTLAAGLTYINGKPKLANSRKVYLPPQQNEICFLRLSQSQRGRSFQRLYSLSFYCLNSFIKWFGISLSLWLLTILRLIQSDPCDLREHNLNTSKFWRLVT